MPDDKDESVLGNLPRARPGRRSDKRTGAKRAATGAQKKRQPAAGATARRSSSSARAAATSRPKARRPPPAPAPPSRGPDPVGDALRLAGKLAEVGIKTAGGIIRRLPGR